MKSVSAQIGYRYCILIDGGVPCFRKDGGHEISIEGL